MPAPIVYSMRQTVATLGLPVGAMLVVRDDRSVQVVLPSTLTPEDVAALAAAGTAVDISRFCPVAASAPPLRLVREG